MPSATELLRGVAQRVVAAAEQRVPLRAALLAGSAGRGDADFFSDIDLLFYVDEVPPIALLDEIRETVEGLNPIRRNEATEHHCGEEFTLEGIRTEISFTTVARVETGLNQLLVALDEVASPSQKILSGLAEGHVFCGLDLIDTWRARLTYSEPFRRAAVERYWSFFPLWYYGEAMSARDTDLWRMEMLVDSALNLLGVLAALNKIYYSRFELKRMRVLIEKMKIAPPHLADRLEGLLHLPADEAGVELGRLVAETRELAVAAIPDVQLPLLFPPGTRQTPWTA